MKPSFDPLSSLIQNWLNSPERAACITNWSQLPAQEPICQSIPSTIAPVVRDGLSKLGIDQLYLHQVKALEFIQNKKNVVISTGTASGKSLCYMIPIFDSLVSDPEATALCLFPTKALTSDQLNSFQELEHAISESRSFGPALTVSIYDGDTPSNQRPQIRKKTRVLLTNPDMLHLAILPHHTIWENYFRNLKYVVIDEVHIYRGVFGSHIANVIRRLKRILKFYGADPIFIMTSATIANPQQLAEKLIETSADWVYEDGSPKGNRNFLIYNPPVINRDLGIRQGVLDTSADLSADLMARHIQSLVFCRTRRGVELLLRKLYSFFPNGNQKIRGYRSGYLKEDRRNIENGLKNGTIQLAAATNALELGVDIGGMDAVILAGYPGTIAATRQQSGRAGRSTRPSLAVMVASMNPLDQYLARHAEYLIDKSTEEALINPDNPLILLQHIQCAAFELPFRKDEVFGKLNVEEVKEYLDFLVSQGILQETTGNYFYMSDSYPSNRISLRNTAGQEILLQLENENGEEKIIGKVDYSSSLWMTHPGAVYLQEGNTYLVRELDLEKNLALLSATDVDYYTNPIKSEEIDILSRIQSEITDPSEYHYGEINATSQVTGFKKIQWDTQQVLSIESLDLPSTTLRTYGFWLSLNEYCVQKMREEDLWQSDPNDYGSGWNALKRAIKARDNYTCQNCGKIETERAFHVHHKVPFRLFTDIRLANSPSNLVTLCPECHKIAEANVRIRSALAGLQYAMNHLAPLLVMSDAEDIGSFSDEAAKFAESKPTVMLFDLVPAGVGLSESLYRKRFEILEKCYDLVQECDCMDGCPSCVGPASENGSGGKKETKRLLEILLGQGA